MLSRHKTRAYIPVANPNLIIAESNRKQFMSELCRIRGLPKQSPYINPCVHGQQIDLLLLYNEVVSLGGSKRVTASSQWDDIAHSVLLFTGCVNTGHALKHIFQNHLEHFEQRNSNGQSFPDFQPTIYTENENFDLSSRNLQIVDNHLRSRWNLSTDLIEPVEYRALLLALHSGLPNELDYAINAILLMSSQQNGLELPHCPQLVSLLLSTVGVFSTNPDTFDTLSKSWKTQCNRDFDKFWRHVVHDGYGRTFLDPNVFSEKDFSLSTDIQISSYTSSSLFNYRDTMSYNDVEGFRVQLVAMVLRNLVVTTPSGNSILLGRDPHLLRFLFLCIYAHHNVLRQLGLDALSFLHFPVVGGLIPALERLLPELLTSSDRVDIAIGLRILRHLCESPTLQVSSPSYSYTPTRQQLHLRTSSSSRNLEFLTNHLAQSTFSALVSILHLRDLHILVLALDTVCALTEQGFHLCRRLLRQQSSSPCLLASLIAYLTFEAQSFGSEGLVRMRVMQVPGGGTATSLVTSASTTTQYNTTSLRRIQVVTEGKSVASPLPTSSVESINNKILLAPAPKPHAGCYAVPVLQEQLSTPIGSSSISDSKPQNSVVSFPTIVSAKTPMALTLPTVIPVAPSLMTTVSFLTTTTTTTTSIVTTPLPVSTPHTKSACFPTPIPAQKSPVINGGFATAKQLVEQPANKRSNGSHHQKTSHLASSLSTAAVIAPAPAIYPDAPSDRREFAVFWLQKNYQVHPQSSFPRVQVYADYQKVHQAHFGSGGALSAVDFHNTIRTVFPLVDQVKVLVPNGNVEIHYNKLKHVDAPEPSEKTLGVKHMIAPFLANYHNETTNAKIGSLKLPVPVKANRKRTSVSLVDIQSLKQCRLEETSVSLTTPSTLANGTVCTAVRPASPIILNGYHHGMKLVTNTSTTATNIMDVTGNNNGPIEIAPVNGCMLQPSSMITAPAYMIPNLDAVTVPGKRLNGSMCTNNLDSSSGAPQLIQFRTLLPNRVTSTTCSTANHPLITNSSVAGKLLVPPRRSSLVMDASTGSGGPQMLVAASQAQQTLTCCLGTLVTASTGSTHAGSLTSGSPQVLFYSIAPPQPNSSTNTLFPLAQLPPTSLTQMICHWGGNSSGGVSCGKVFGSSNQLFSHVYSAHFTPILKQESTCRWLNCKETMRRAPFSLLNHLHEVHCARPTANPLRLVSGQQQQQASLVNDASDEKSSLLTTLQPSSTTSAGAKLAAAANSENVLRAQLQSDFLPSVKEGPVTKHIRLTTALILHNLATYSPTARRQLMAYEPVLCELALAGGEASSTLAKCLSLVSSLEDERIPTDDFIPPAPR